MDLSSDAIDPSLMTLVQLSLLPVALTFLLYGAFAISAGLAIYLLLRRPRYSFGILWMLAVVLLMLCIGSLHIIFAYIFESLDMYSTRFSEVNGESATAVLDTMNKAYALHAVTVLLNLWLGDSIILSRMWNICPESRTANFANTALYLASAVPLTLRYSLDPVRPPNGSTARQFALEDATLALLFLVNVIGTGMMVRKQRRINPTALRLARGANDRTTQVIRILVEYGIVYCLIQLFNLSLSIVMHWGMLSLPTRTTTTVHKIVTPAVAMFAGIFPTLTLALVAIRNAPDRTSTVSIQPFTNSDPESFSTNPGLQTSLSLSRSDTTIYSSYPHTTSEGCSAMEHWKGLEGCCV